MTQINSSDITKIGGYRDFGYIDIIANQKRYKIRADELLKFIKDSHVVFDVDAVKGRRSRISQSPEGDLKRATDKFELMAGENAE